MATPKVVEADKLPPELVIPLSPSVEHDGVTYTELRLREPTAGEVEQLVKSPVGSRTAFGVGLVAGVPPEAIRKLGIRQVRQASEYILGFVEGELTAVPGPPLPPSRIITLAKAVTFAGETYTELRLREPTAGEVEMITGDGWEGDIHGVALISGVPMGAIRQAGIRDLRRGADYLLGFILGDLTTGKIA